ncbi:MAG: hypothetical protein M0Q91_05200 [Methanoregula sp.]|jgi:hypothetical protein|nr:hypothetical protein [Methanoregula sp.]
MTQHMRPFGKFVDRPLSIEPYLSYLQERLHDESNGSVRKYIRRKLKLLQGSTPKPAKPFLISIVKPTL